MSSFLLCLEKNLHSLLSTRRLNIIWPLSYTLICQSLRPHVLPLSPCSLYPTTLASLFLNKSNSYLPRSLYWLYSLHILCPQILPLVTPFHKSGLCSYVTSSGKPSEIDLYMNDLCNSTDLKSLRGRHSTHLTIKIYLQPSSPPGTEGFRCILLSEFC